MSTGKSSGNSGSISSVSQQSGSGGPSQATSPSGGMLGGIHGSNSQSPRPPHYLKQHLQHKMGFTGTGPGGPGPAPGTAGVGAVTSHSPPQGYPGMGPPNVSGMHHHSMGPPSMGTHMGSHNMSMGPPIIGQSNSHDGPMPPPSSTPNSHMPIGSASESGSATDSVDNGITTTAASNVGTHVTPSVSGAPSVTSVVTTGPDGTTIDEGSQQSTLSNASIGKSFLIYIRLGFTTLYVCCSIR